MISVIVIGKNVISAAKRRGITLTSCSTRGAVDAPLLADELHCKAPCSSLKAVSKWFDESVVRGRRNKRRLRSVLRSYTPLQCKTGGKSYFKSYSRRSR